LGYKAMPPARWDYFVWQSHANEITSMGVYARAAPPLVSSSQGQRPAARGAWRCKGITRTLGPSWYRPSAACSQPAASSIPRCRRCGSCPVHSSRLLIASRSSLARSVVAPAPRPSAALSPGAQLERSSAWQPGCLHTLAASSAIGDATEALLGGPPPGGRLPCHVASAGSLSLATVYLLSWPCLSCLALPVCLLLARRRYDISTRLNYDESLPVAEYSPSASRASPRPASPPRVRHCGWCARGSWSSAIARTTT
jgi:hypothetical protein